MLIFSQGGRFLFYKIHIGDIFPEQLASVNFAEHPHYYLLALILQGIVVKWGALKKFNTPA